MKKKLNGAQITRIGLILMYGTWIVIFTSFLWVQRSQESVLAFLIVCHVLNLGAS